MTTKPEPLTRDEITFRQRQAEDMLASWRAEKPVNHRASDLQAVNVIRYEDQLRLLATIADLQARALDEEAIGRIATDVAERVNGTVSINWRALEDGDDVLADFASDVRDGINDEIARMKVTT